jgi:hypothetical protein
LCTSIDNWDGFYSFGKTDRRAVLPASIVIIFLPKVKRILLHLTKTDGFFLVHEGVVLIPEPILRFPLTRFLLNPLTFEPKSGKFSG